KGTSKKLGWKIVADRRTQPFVRGECAHQRVALLLLGSKHARPLVLAEPRQHGLGAHESWRHHQLIAEHETIDNEVMAVDLPAPRIAWRGVSKDAEPIEPLPVFFGLAGDLESVLVELHDVAGASVSRCAHAFAHQAERGPALIISEISEANAVS